MCETVSVARDNNGTDDGKEIQLGTDGRRRVCKIVAGGGGNETNYGRPSSGVEPKIPRQERKAV